MKRSCRKYLYVCLCLTILLGICRQMPGRAEEELSDLKVSILDSKGLSETVTGLQISLPVYSWESMDVYRAADGGAFKLLDTLSHYSTSYTDASGDWYSPGKNKKVMWYPGGTSATDDTLYDTSGKLGHTYAYRLILRSDESRGPVSNTVSVSTVLSAPDLMDAVRVSSSSVKLTWVRTKAAGGYELQRKKKGSSWKKIKSVSKKSRTYTDKNLKKGTYNYRIRAWSKAGGKKIYSNWSNVVLAKTSALTVKGNYSPGSVYGPSLSSKQLTDVRAVVQNFKDNYIKKSMSDLDKAWLAFSFLRFKCSYATRGWQYNEANSAWGALVYGEAQCSGYARAMKALCDAIGLKCYYVHANAAARNPSHQWNMVRIKGKWYILDAQGGFFLVGSKYWNQLTGLTWNKRGLPSCSKANHPQGGFVSSEM